MRQLAWKLAGTLLLGALVADTGSAGEPSGENVPSSELTAQEWYEHAMRLVRDHQRDAAVAAFERSVALDPKRALTWANRGTNLLNLGRYAEAVASYERALEIEPDDSYVYCSLATVYNQTDEPESALASAEKAIEIDEEFVWARFNLATALRALGREDDADRVLEEAYALRPDLREAPKKD